MRVIHNYKQIARLSGASHSEEGDGLPSYIYHAGALPEEIIELLKAFHENVEDEWRDFLNDDGGYSVINDTTEEFDLPYFGMNKVSFGRQYLPEIVNKINCKNGEVWWDVLFVINNETCISFNFKDELLNHENRKWLTKYIG